MHPSTLPPPRILVALLGCALAGPAWSQVPSALVGTAPVTDQGAPFQLPQNSYVATGRRIDLSQSNALTVAWDGRLVMYADSDDTSSGLWNNRPAGTFAEGFVFATFDKSSIDAAGGTLEFSKAFGTPLARFAEINTLTAPDPGDGNDYPGFSGFVGGYPRLLPTAAGNPGSMGELGLREVNFLSNNMFPVPGAEQYGHNPWPSTSTGKFDAQGTHLTYDMYVTFQDLPKFWDTAVSPDRWRGVDRNGNFQPTSQTVGYTDYELGTYPNGLTVTNTSASNGGPERIKRNGRARLGVITAPASGKVLSVTVKEKWIPFEVTGDGTWGSASGLTVGQGVPSTTTMWADNFEPTLTLDGHLMVAKGSRLLATREGPSRVLFYYNQTAFGTTGWEGPWDLHQLYHKRLVALGTDQRTIEERYPLSRRQLLDYDGDPFGDSNGDGTVSQAELDSTYFEGGYTWLSPDGRFVIYSVKRAGVGGNAASNHPQSAVIDGGGSSNRGNPSIIGSVTGWQAWRIDHAAENPSRHLFTAWDQDSRSTHMRTASFGFTPGFWELLRGADGLPLRDDGRTKLQLVQSSRLLYYELDLSPYQERDYGLYLPMCEMLDLDPTTVFRQIDITRTPDHSSNGHPAAVEGGQLPCEYFQLPEQVEYDFSGPNPPLGLHVGAANINDIGAGWPAAEAIQAPGTNLWWARLADGPEGANTDPVTGLNTSQDPDTTPWEGRGEDFDMDSDTAWGRVGQAMFFAEGTNVRVANDGSATELNPGTGGSTSDELTVHLWVQPLQSRSGTAILFDHHVDVALLSDGQILAVLKPTSGPLVRLYSGTALADVLDWTHVAVTWEAGDNGTSDARLYIDGALADEVLAIGADQLVANSGDITAGCLGAAGAPTGDAVLVLDEVALKNSAITARQANELALQPLPVDPNWSSTGLPDGPLGFDNTEDARMPAGTAYSAYVAKIGADLFNDIQLSGTPPVGFDKVSCATCHIADLAFTDGLATPPKFSTSGNLLRNTPSILNQRFNVHQFWDARAVNLEDQSLEPVKDPDEMGSSVAAVLAYLDADSDYSARFTSAFGGGGVTEAQVQEALAMYMRSPTSGGSRVDEFEAGIGSLTSPELAGRGLFFGEARCSGCHNGPNLTDGRLWTTGTFRSDGHDDGASRGDSGEETAGRARFRGSFKTPSLRQLVDTGPYFHDGHATSLASVVDFYDAGGVRVDSLGHPLSATGHDVAAEEINRELGLTDTEKADLVAYLEALSGEIDLGESGANQAPVPDLEKTYGILPGGAPTNTALVTIEVTDLDPGDDFATALDQTFELTVGPATYRWSDGSVSTIANGHKWTKNVAASSFAHLQNMQVRVADKHGLFSGWVN